MKTKITTYYDLQNKVNKRWELLDTRTNLRHARIMLKLYKTSGLWHSETLRIVKRVVISKYITSTKTVVV